MIINCDYCKKPYDLIPAKVKAYKNHFCSRLCKGKWMSNQKTEDQPRYKHGLSAGSKFRCLNCGKESIRNIIRQKYCTVSCQMKYEYRMGKRRQDNQHHNGWKGNDAQYSAIHVWIRKNKAKPLYCEDCSKVTHDLEVANISGEYKRDINDFEYLCRKCHMEKDGRNEKLRNSYKSRREGNLKNKKLVEKIKIIRCLHECKIYTRQELSMIFSLTVKQIDKIIYRESYQYIE